MEETISCSSVHVFVEMSDLSHGKSMLPDVYDLTIVAEL